MKEKKEKKKRKEREIAREGDTFEFWIVCITPHEIPLCIPPRFKGVENDETKFYIRVRVPSLYFACVKGENNRLSYKISR